MTTILYWLDPAHEVGLLRIAAALEAKDFTWLPPSPGSGGKLAMSDVRGWKPTGRAEQRSSAGIAPVGD